MARASAREIKAFLIRQVTDRVARKELQSLGPPGIDWISRVLRTIDHVSPKLPSLAQYIYDTVPTSLNNPHEALELYKAGKKYIRSNEPEAVRWSDNMEKILSSAQANTGNLESQQVSAAIQRAIVSEHGIGNLVVANGNSIYPDLIMRNYDYRGLPMQDRKKTVDGPCLQGRKIPRPSNVPDGIEIKTNQSQRIRVDAHGAHAGVHIAITWDLINSRVHIHGVWAAYVRICDHKESQRNVSVTTVKYSFGHSLFMPVLTS
jgi:hypothetical protein